MNNTEDALFRKLKVLNETIWESRADEPLVTEWLDNFTSSSSGTTNDRLHALFLLSNVIYFGSKQMRELMKSLFRDLYQYPILESIRRRNGDTISRDQITQAFSEELRRTQFLGVGNPSESGCHLLYYFRQENYLPKTHFVHTHQLFRRDSATGSISIRSPDIRRYVFIDDFCGSGKQGTEYSRDVVSELKRLNPDAFVAYYVIFATAHGIKKVRKDTKFDEVECVYELDSTFKCFSNKSRHFANLPSTIEKSYAEQMCRVYGSRLWPSHPLGYDDCQLLIAFHHNTPDNTLPIIWYDEPDGVSWTPIFRRYPKYYGWS